MLIFNINIIQYIYIYHSFISLNNVTIYKYNFDNYIKRIRKSYLEIKACYYK